MNTRSQQQKSPLKYIEMFFDTLDNKLEKDLKVHLKNVYTCLAIALLAAASGAYVHVFTNILKGNLLISLAAIGIFFLLYLTEPTPANEGKRFCYFMAFAFAMGLSTGPLLDFVININPKIPVTAFMGTCLIFGCFSLAALYAPDRKFLYLGGTLMSLMSMLFWLSLANLFFGVKLLFDLSIYLGLAAMCGFILYDTQIIMEKRRMGSNDYILHSLDLFIDFIEVFRYLMIILAQKDRDSKKKRND